MKKIMMLILDGFSMREEEYGNAVKNAGMNNFINVWNEYPHCLLKSSGEAIDLPENQCGNSYLGHKIIGAGRKVSNRLTKTERYFKENKFNQNIIYNDMIRNLKNDDTKNIHILILLSDGGVLSHINHLKYFLKELQSHNLHNNIYIHAISDGEDSARYSFLKYYKEIIPYLNDHTFLASICGRYYCLEPKNVNGINNYYDLLFKNKGLTSPTPEKLIELCYQKKICDKYIPPVKIAPFIQIKENDNLIFLNFENESQHLLIDNINSKQFNNINLYSLFEMSDKNFVKGFLKNDVIPNTLNKYLSNVGLEQVRIFESCKSSCLYYLDGNRNIKLPNCHDYIVKTPKVENYAMKPEMNALTITKVAIECMEQDHDFIMVNFANGDMLGHTGNYEATINSLQVIDLCLNKIIENANNNFYKIIITGTHGNVDTMISENKEIIAKNTLSPVPFIIMDKKIKLRNGSLYSVAPTILKYMDIALPKEMKATEILIEED